LTSLALEVIQASNRQTPADTAMRHRLAREKGLGRRGAAEVANLVFTWFRWRGFVEVETPTPQALEQALDWARRFAADERCVSGDDLRRAALPAWVLGMLAAGEDWLRALQRPPSLWLRARPGQGASLEAVLDGSRPAGEGWLADALEYRGAEDLYRSKAFQEGAFEIQDIASQAVGAVCRPEPGSAWWDACAGEGGKMLHLADLMANRGLIWATDRAAWRLAQLRRRAARARVFNWRSALWNGGPRLPIRTKFDGILVDAPCSGLGTWQRNPHARWTCMPADLTELATLQGRLLDHVAPQLKPGGRLIYAVCTLTDAETRDVVARFSEAHPEFEPEPVANPFDAGDPPRSSWLWWPADTRGNGMFVAAWRRQ
jgi:16S rRNA (cytosine967-C5)-methyltransferase